MARGWLLEVAGQSAFPCAHGHYEDRVVAVRDPHYNRRMDSRADTPVSGMVKQLTDGLAPILADYPAVVAAYFHGSAAEGRATPLSDVDVALVCRRDVEPYQALKMELRIESRLAEEAGIRNADVRCLNDAPLLVRGAVACNGILVYCADDDARVAFETSTWSEYFDYLPLAIQLREAFLADVRERGLCG